MSAVCSQFGCTPAEAEVQDTLLVHQVTEYRNAKRAIALINAHKLHEHPELMDVLLDLKRAQLGVDDPDEYGEADLGIDLAKDFPEQEESDE